MIYAKIFQRFKGQDDLCLRQSRMRLARARQITGPQTDRTGRNNIPVLWDATHRLCVTNKCTRDRGP